MDKRYWLYEIGPIDRTAAESVEGLVRHGLGSEATVDLIDPHSWFGRAMDVDTVRSAVSAFETALGAGALSVDDAQIVTGLLSDMTTWLDGEHGPGPDMRTGGHHPG